MATSQHATNYIQHTSGMQIFYIRYSWFLWRDVIGSTSNPGYRRLQRHIFTEQECCLLQPKMSIFATVFSVLCAMALYWRCDLWNYCCQCQTCTTHSDKMFQLFRHHMIIYDLLPTGILSSAFCTDMLLRSNKYFLLWYPNINPVTIWSI